MTGAVIVLGFVAIFVVILISSASAASAKAKAERMKHLAAIAAHLGGQHDDSGKAWGSALGPKTTFEFATRGAGSSAENWTHIEVEIPKAYPLAIHVRRHLGADQRVIARGDMVDVLVGDREFDDAFLVEAAPADVVRALFDAEVRAMLAAHTRVDLDTVEHPDGTRSLKLGIAGWLEDLDRARPPLAAMGKLGANVREAYAKADAVHGPLVAGDPYRPVVDAQPARDAQAGRESEVGRVKQVRDKRAADADAMVIGVTVLIGVLTAIAIAVAMR